MTKKPGKIERTGQPDPLAGTYGQPIVGVTDPSKRYLGRVIIELYESEGSSDSQALAYIVDPAPEAGLDNDTLANRIAEAFAARVKRTSFSKKP